MTGRYEIRPPGVGGLDTPYSWALKVGDTVRVSGQVPLDAEGRLVGRGDLVAQAEQVFTNIDLLVRAAGGDMSDLVEITYYTTQMERFSELELVRRRWLRPPYPASTGVEVSRLFDPEWLIEISAVAVLSAREPA